VKLPSGGERMINVLIEAPAPGTPAGLGGPVTVELTGSNESAIISKIL